MKWIGLLASLFAATAVILGAFGSHGLKDKLPDAQLSSWEIGVRYQLFHAIALFILVILMQQFKVSNLSGWLFSFGTLLFSGSIYSLATRELTGISTSILGPLTPIGGLLLICGWLVLGYQLFQKLKSF